VIAFDPSDPHVLWFNIWRNFVRASKEDNKVASACCREMMFSQMRYVCEVALKLAKEKSQ
jgi:hypothetical protein